MLGIEVRSPDRDAIQGFVEEEDEPDPVIDGLRAAAANLKRFTGPQTMEIWSPRVVKQLWQSFYSNMEGLHFQSERDTSEHPTPLLLAAILYVSALHHTSDKLAALAPHYFRATCSAIAELSIPSFLKTSELRVSFDKNNTPASAEQIAFQNVLGLILAGLISEAFIDLTGIWISIGYRLCLDYCPVWVDERSSKWRQLFSGLQIIDLEHASLHLSCPVIPLKAPLPSLRQLQSFVEDPFKRLTEMMHVGLSHFAGRGLPTIWSFVSSTALEGSPLPIFPFTDTDAKIIKEWAKNLDDWLATSNSKLGTITILHATKSQGPSVTQGDRIQIMRQYSLHRLFVLSIYHPARGFDLFADNVASIERHELLLSARTTLRLQNNDKGIWANWDLVIITWAAIIVLQATEGGVGEHDDLPLVQTHLNMLKRTHRPAPSLCHTLASRLETWLQSINTPPDGNAELTQLEYDPSWAIFDENSIRLAPESLFQQLNDAPSNTENVQQSHDLTLMSPQSRGFGNTRLWSGHEQVYDTWPPNFLRLFGSADYQPQNNAMSNQ
ncbi:hypothetical protein B0O99DRAFT_153855 [Bisporella sp. PMI_857]|nr:hypothetical protein B0O99DRAFT_153855 [Bisporella sp. PMI_857]